MQLVQLMIPSEAAHDTVAALGEVGMIQFKDLNTHKSAFQRTYANQVKRCDEMARKLRFLAEQVHKANLPISGRGWDKTITMDELEITLEQLEKETIVLNSNDERLLRTRAELAELQLLLEKAGQFFQSAQVASRSTVVTNLPKASTKDLTAPLLEAEAQGGDSGTKFARLGFIAGLIQTQRMNSFERLLFRATRGNVFLRNVEVGKVQDPATTELQEKSVFVVFFAGERAKAKINKICEAFGANRYPFPEEVSAQRQMHAEVTSRLTELHTTIEAGSFHRQGVLQTVSQNLENWTLLVRKEKAIYHALNKMNIDFTRKVLVAEAWVPSSARTRVSEALRVSSDITQAGQVTSVMQSLPTAHHQPPTYFVTNKFTSCFQTIVDAYGVANYREVNPAVFTIMTFPFLFAVMFGDFGHGILMLLFALFLVLSEKSMGAAKLDDITSMLFGGRYCILLMALFSIYTGALYNEFFSIPMTMLAGPSSFGCFIGDEESPSGPVDLRDCSHAHGEIRLISDPYPFGVDPAWRGTNTELPYLNSLKMKLSILLGVVHMNLGILMSLFNHTYFRDTLSTWCEFVPQVIFLNSLFGYLCFLIVQKWVTGSLVDLYHVLIYMFLKPGEIDNTGFAFQGQGLVQNTLLLLALVSVPWMLLPKPFILKARHEASKAHGGHDEGYQQVQQEEEGAQGAEDHELGGPNEEHGAFEFGEVIVHQMIHTIEFVLGAVSNTASYLRLWALSLAHSQLSSVFYDRVLMAGMQANGEGGLQGAAYAVVLMIAFFVWALATLGVLMVMESLSAFLHALRLHWVEFQNKFYRGTGWQFTPFSFAALAEELTDSS